MQAQVLEVDWRYMGGILAGVPAAQLLLLCVVAYVSSAAIIKDTSYLAAAQLLKPVVERLGPHGCILSGDDIARVVGNIPVVYGGRCSTPKSSDKSVYHVDVIPASEAIESDVYGVWKPGQKMPKGWYDGTGQQTTNEDTLRRARKLKQE